jgi:hypothetical protein
MFVVPDPTIVVNIIAAKGLSSNNRMTAKFTGVLGSSDRRWRVVVWLLHSDRDKDPMMGFRVQVSTFPSLHRHM